MNDGNVPQPSGSKLFVPAFSSVNTIQPGEWFSIYGTNLASTITSWNGTFTNRKSDFHMVVGIGSVVFTTAAYTPCGAASGLTADQTLAVETVIGGEF
jgi:hypothetical protein